jgi:hypothetical protein
MKVLSNLNIHYQSYVKFFARFEFAEQKVPLISSFELAVPKIDYREALHYGSQGSKMIREPLRRSAEDRVGRPHQAHSTQTSYADLTFDVPESQKMGSGIYWKHTNGIESIPI